MFSPDIVCSDAFLDMPTSSRELYFQLGMKADDDGFVNPRSIMRLAGSSEDDLRMLVGKRFVLPFENGVIVIKHWKMNNLIKNDRYKPTVYREQFQSLEVKENGAYTERKHLGTILEPQVRLGKDRLLGADAQILEVPDSEESTRPQKEKRDTKYKQVFSLFSKKQQGWMMHKPQIEAAKRLLEQRGLPQIEKALTFYKENRDEPFMVEIDTPYDLEAKWNKLVRKSKV